MPENSAGMVLERAALLAAQEHFAQWHKTWGNPAEEEVPDRLAFNALARSVASLQRALAEFVPTRPGNRQALLSLLQQGATLRPQQTHAHDLAALDKHLGHLGIAAASGGGRGATASASARAWIQIAADQWESTLGKTPSAAARGRFWLALNDLQSDLAARLVILPQVSPDMLRAVLPIWRQARGMKD